MYDALTDQIDRWLRLRPRGSLTPVALPIHGESHPSQCADGKQSASASPITR